MKKFIFSRKILLTIPLLLILLHFIFITITRWQLPASLIQQKVQIEGVIDSIPEKKPHGWQFQFHANKINQQKINAHFLLTWYGYTPHLHVGDVWQLVVKLKPPLGFHNPGGFDYKRYLLSHGITATGYVITHNKNNHILAKNPIYFFDHFRQAVQQQIDNTIKNQTIAAFISALSVGLRTGLTESDWQVFQKTGTNHLVAVAGLHIGFVFATIYFLARKIIKVYPSLFLFFPASQCTDMIALLVALSYSALSGLAIPAQRASMMLLLFIVPRLFYKNISATRRLIFAASVTLFINPLNIIDVSFWLSFSSILILGWVMSGRMRSPHHLISWAKMQIGILIGLLPLMLFFFQQISIIAFFTNAIAIPWVGLLILPMTLLATFLFLLHLTTLSHFVFYFAGRCLMPLWRFLVYVSHYSFSSWHHAVVNPWILLFSLIGCFLLLAPSGFSLRLFGFFGLLPLFFYHAPNPSIGNVRVMVMDVGEGLSVLVQTAHHAMLYDTGNYHRVTPILQSQNITHINCLVLSDTEKEDVGDASWIENQFKIASVMQSTSSQWNWDGVTFWVNCDDGCIAKITGKKGSILLTGDMIRSAENALAKQYGAQLASTVLLLPHHGSRAALSNSFISAVSPTDIIISAAKYNRYHFPSPSVIAYFSAHLMNMYNTADFGAIIIRFRQKGDVKLSTTERDHLSP